MSNAAESALALIGDPSPFRGAIDVRREAPAVGEATVTLVADAPAAPPAIQIGWDEPRVDVAAIWTPTAGEGKTLTFHSQIDREPSSATIGAPVACLLNASGLNRLCVAVSDAVHPVGIGMRVVEETASVRCSLQPFRPGRLADRFEVILRLDRREVPYEIALADAVRWWEGLPGQRPAPVPDAARQPMYSTWYSFHQRLEASSLEEQCRRAKELGCAAVIIDDGWQTLDDRRGYAYCGDWEPERLPQLSELVARLHQIGMRVLLWFAPPLAGVRSRAYERFRGKLLRVEDSLGAGILDPREPEVRAYLVDRLQRAVDEWDLDGLKIDFIERWTGTGTGAEALGQAASVEAAAANLLTEVAARLRARRPELLIEFRQPYIGPRMRAVANMFRALDCPGDYIRNRVSTVDLRLLSGATAVHSDMLTWNASEPTESAALQLLAVLFSVPQISVQLDAVPADHVEMLGFWLGFWRAKREVLLDGDLHASSPELNYPMVTTRLGSRQVSAAYLDGAVLTAEPGLDELHLVNATRGGRLAVDLEEDWEGARLEVRDCRGRVVENRGSRLQAGAHALDVPPAGLASLSRD